MKNGPGQMPLDLFKRIIQKAKSEGYTAILFTNWTEPLLCSTLDEYISAVKEERLYCMVSTNLSLEPTSVKATIEKTLAATPDQFVVSVSGYEQSVYEVNHAGGTISWVKENLELIADLKRRKTTRTPIYLKFFRFDYNSGEERPLSDFAKHLGLNFLPVEGYNHPSMADQFARDQTETRYADALRDYTPLKTRQKAGEICYLIMRDIPIDHRGDVYLCCAMPNYPMFNFGPFLDRPYEEILFQRYSHPHCQSCSAGRRKMTADERAMLQNGLR